MRVFLAGATGAVGFEFARLAKAKGYLLQTLSRSPENARKLEGIANQVTVGDASKSIPNLRGADVVVSALGAPVTMGGSEKRSYREVDLKGNRNILEAASAAGVPRFVYVSVHVEPGYSDTAYVCAHEEFVDALRRSGLSYSIIRPTGIFHAYNDFVMMANKGMATVIGNGTARTNPVDAADVAAEVMAVLENGQPEVSVGGPEILSRRAIAELAFKVLGRRPRIISVPPAVFRFSARLAALVNPRLGDLFEFATAVSLCDCIAPAVGRKRLEDHFRNIAVHEGVVNGN